MSPILMFYLRMIMMTLISVQSVTILKDDETWTDDYIVNSNGIDGWKYPPSLIPPIIGSDRTYHGWYYRLYQMQYHGYFYRQFQCEYASNININFRIYFGCEYDPNDGAILYINTHSFRFSVSQYTLSNYTDAVAINQTNQCTSNYKPGTFIGFDANTFSIPIHVEAYTTFDIGFIMINTYSVLTQEFGAISDIQIVCNKINTTKQSPDIKPSAPTPTVTVSHPFNNVACSNMEQSICNTDDICRWNDSKCTCNGGDGMDIIFGIGMLSNFEYNTVGQSNMQQWFIDDILPNINNQISRIGLILFDEKVKVHMNMAYYSNTEVYRMFSNVSWVRGYLNYPAFFEQIAAQFDSIQTPNKQKILVIITDGNPRIPPSGEYITICSYRNLLASRGIRVIMVVINHIGNQPRIADFDCITQNPFDLFLTPLKAPILYEDLHEVTDKLSAALCSYTTSSPTLIPTSLPTLNPTTSPTLIPTLNPTTIDPTVSPTLHSIGSIYSKILDIEMVFNFQNISNITMEISNIILSIVAVEGNLERDQINMTLYRNTVILKAKGDEHQINDITQSVNNGDLEREIQDEIGQRPTITMTQTDDMTISTIVDPELKRLIIVLIILVSVLIFVIIIVSLICCYCLFIEKKDSIKLSPTSVTPRARGYQNVEHESHEHHKTVSIPSMTGYSSYGIPIIVPTVYMDRDNDLELPGEDDIELPSHDVVIIPEDIIHNVDETIDGEYHENSCSDNNGLYGPGMMTKVDEESMNESSDDDGDAMYLKNDAHRKTKGK